MDDQSKVITPVPEKISILKGRFEYCTIGPVPVNGVVEIMTQLDRQEWKTKFVSFSGMVSMQGSLSVAKPVPMPSYVIIAEKYFNGDDEMVAPTIKFGGK